MRRLAMALGCILLLAGLAGCIGNDATDDDLETAGDDGDEEAGGQNPDDAGDGSSGEVIQESTASWVTSAAGCTGFTLRLSEAADGVNNDKIQVEPASHGHAFNATLDSNQEPVHWGVQFWDEMAGTLETHQTTEATMTGTVPDGTVSAVFYSCAGYDHEVTFTVTSGGSPSPSP